MSEEERLNSALNLMRRMPPARCENSLAGLIELAPDLTDDLLNHVDQPLKVEKDEKANRNFVLCDYNRDGDSYRSPWSNTYFPAMEDGFLPSDKLREMEKEANQLFDVYRHQYFEGGYSSVYFFDTEDEGSDGSAFGACWLVHKDVPAAKTLKSGWWDSIHVFEVNENKSKKGTFTYKLTTTVMVSMNLKDPEKTGDVDLSGNMTKQTVKDKKLKEGVGHVQNMGVILEELELSIRNSIEGIYIQKTREIVNGMRNPHAEKSAMWDDIAKNLAGGVSELRKKRSGMS